MTIVISQPMYFPWIGMYEQMRLADNFVYYDDVAFSKGSFSNRVQVKTSQGSSWLTVPLLQDHSGQKIMDLPINERSNWRKKHLATLRQSYARAPFASEMLSLVESVFETTSGTLADVAIRSQNAVCDYFQLENPSNRVRSSELNVPCAGSERVLALVKRMEGDRYVTGHGARNYLDHEMFDRAGVEVRYMEYQKVPYPQLHGEFTPYVTTLDLIANCGRDGGKYIRSQAVHWKVFLS